jgi:hypothetical protein
MPRSITSRLLHLLSQSCLDPAAVFGVQKTRKHLTGGALFFKMALQLN